LKESSTYDCSVDDQRTIYLPCSWLIKKMNLCWNGVEGNFFNQKNDLIAFDPSIKEFGANACLIKREALLEFLNQNNYDIIWTFLAEKRVIKGNPKHDHLQLSGIIRLDNKKLLKNIRSKPLF
ncbi:hypothetical protein IQ215_13325, partial [Cyanobacterium stanieri LEGE 03274]